MVGVRSLGLLEQSACREAIIHVVAFILGLLFVTDAGLFFLDVVDFYVNYLLLFVGFLEAFAGGKSFRTCDYFEVILD